MVPDPLVPFAANLCPFCFKSFSTFIFFCLRNVGTAFGHISISFSASLYCLPFCVTFCVTSCVTIHTFSSSCKPFLDFLFFQCDQIWPFWQNIQRLAQFLRVYLLFGRILHQLWQNFVCHWASFHSCRWPIVEK